MSDFDIVDKLISNEKMNSPSSNGGWSNEPYVKPKKKFVKRPPGKDATAADMKLSGWDLDHDPDYIEPHNVGDVVGGAKVLRVGSKYGRACVYCPEFWMYGWGSTVDDALKSCSSNIAQWKKNNTGTQPIKHKSEKSAADILDEVGL